MESLHRLAAIVGASSHLKDNHRGLRPSPLSCSCIRHTEAILKRGVERATNQGDERTGVTDHAARAAGIEELE